MANYVTPTSDKKKSIALLLCICGGFIGLHRYYVGKIGTGILYTFTFGGFGLGWFADLISICLGKFKDNVGMPLRVVNMSSPIEFVNASMDELSAYKKALLETEYKIMDWLKRVDQKETEAFIEIAQGVNLYKEFNGQPLKDGSQFERFASGVLSWNGFSKVTVTPLTNDFGGDITAEKDGLKFVFQCKYYTLPVGVEAVQEVYAAKVHYSAHVAVVITNSVFTKAAKILAEESGVSLWGGDRFREMIDTAKDNLKRKSADV